MIRGFLFIISPFKEGYYIFATIQTPATTKNLIMRARTQRELFRSEMRHRRRSVARAAYRPHCPQPQVYSVHPPPPPPPPAPILSVPSPRIPASRPRAPRRQFAHRPAPPLPSRARVCGVVFVFVLASARTCRCVRTLCLPQSTPNTKQTRTRTRTRTHANCFPDGNIVSKS